MKYIYVAIQYLSILFMQILSMTLVQWLAKGTQSMAFRGLRRPPQSLVAWKVVCRARLTAFKSGKYQEGNTSSDISFSKLHSWRAVGCRHRALRRIIALPEMLKPTLASAPTAQDTNRDVMPSHSSNGLSLVASCLMTFQSSAPSIPQPPCRRLSFCSFKSPFLFLSHLPHLSYLHTSLT